MSQERREHLVRSGSADAQKFRMAAVKPVYDSMTVEVEKMKVGNISKLLTQIELHSTTS